METTTFIATKDYILPSYQSDSSNDSAITCEFDEDALQQREIIKRNDGYYEDAAADQPNSTSDFKELVFNFTCLALENTNVLNNYRLSEIVELIRPYYKPIIEIDPETQKYLIFDRFGFIHKEMNEKEAFLQQVLIEILNSKSEKAWTYGNCENLKTLVREYGIPNELRPKIWLAIIRNKVSNNYNIDNLLELAEETIQMFEFGIDEMNIRQIDLDICRTMPNHQMFNEKANGLDKLKKILVAYSIHVNPCVGYCQSMNFLAALLLIIFNGNEKHALMGLICIIDYCFPANYFDENLTGARADQMLLRDLILKKLASKIPYKDEEELKFKLNKYSSKIDEITGSLSLNWFLSLFHNAVPWQTRLYILDCFWLEGMKVLFRFGLALLPLENKLTYLDAKEGDNRIGDLINQMKEECSRCHDVDLLRKIAFRQLTIPGRRELRVKRSIYLQRIQESLMAAKDKEEKLNEQTLHHSEPEIDLSSEEEIEKRPTTANDANAAAAKNAFKRSSSSTPQQQQQQQQPANRLNWLRKRLSLANFYPLSMQRQAASAQKNAYRGLNGVRSCEAISRNGERLVQMIASPEHYQSRVLLQLRDCTYSHIFYPNRRSSIVLSDNEQHQNAILTLRNLYNKDLFLAGVSDDGKWVVLLDQMSKKFHCGWLKDSNVNVLILSVPFAVRGWYFDELSWQVICLDKENQLWRCDLADPARSSLCTDFLRKQLSNEPKSNSNLNMLAYDDKYCLLWVHMVTKISSEDQTEEVLKRNSLSERMTLSLDLTSEDEDVLLQNGHHTTGNHLNGKLSKKDDAVFKSSLEDLLDDEEEDSDPNDLCSCSTESPNGCDHDHDDAFGDEPFKSEFLENNKCVKNCTERCVSSVAQHFENEPIANRLLSRRVTISTIFRRNSLIILDSSPTDPSTLSDYLINKHGHANLSSTAKDQLKEQKEFQCTVRFALENRIRMHKLFESKQLNSSHSSFATHSVQTQHSQQSSQSQKRPRRHVFHQDNHKNDDLTKIDTNTNENLNRQQLFVFDSCSMELFGILKLDPLDGRLQRIFCLGGVAYCGFDDGSITAITVSLSGSSEQPTNRRQLLQPQPEDELIDLRVFNANNTVRMDTIIQQKLAEHLNSRSESMSSKESISSSPAKSNNNSTSIDEEEDDDEELVHFDAILMNNSRKNSVNPCAGKAPGQAPTNPPSTPATGSIMHSFANLGSTITNSITSSLISTANNNSIFNSVSYTKERLNKTSSNSSSEFSFEKKRLENLSEDGVSGADCAASPTDPGCCKSGPHSPTSRCSRAERNLPSLTTIFNNSVNSAFLVLALYKSGKLHCIYLKSGCVQERKLFRIDVQLKSELPINSLRIVNAFRMNWSDEQSNGLATDDEQAANNLNDLITNLNGESNELSEADELESNETCDPSNGQNGGLATGLDRIDENNNSRPVYEDDEASGQHHLNGHSAGQLNGSNEEARLTNGRDELSENNGHKQKRQAVELNGTVNQVHQQTSKDANERAQSNGDPTSDNATHHDATNNDATNNGGRRDSSQLEEEFEQSKSKLSKRSSINANQCNYLVTLWSPHPINRLVNVKL